jgi:hypothetical protein
MTQQNLLELAKQGDPQAIAALMNRSLQPKGIVATVERQGDRLRVLLEATQLPNREAMTLFVQKGIVNLGIPLIRSIDIQGRQTGSDQPVWQQQVNLSESTETPTTATAATDLPRPIAPPPRPIPPPVPPLRPVSPPLPRIATSNLKPEDDLKPEDPLESGDTVKPENDLGSRNALEFRDALEQRLTPDNPDADLLPDSEITEQPIATQPTPRAIISDPQAADTQVADSIGEEMALGNIAPVNIAPGSGDRPDLQESVQSNHLDQLVPVPDNVHAGAINEPDLQAEADLSVEPTVDQPVRRSSGQSFAVPIVLLLLAGWIGAIVGYAMWSALTAPTSPSPVESPTVPPPLPLPTPTPPLRSPVSQVDLIDSYQAALRRGTQAERLAQSAQSVDDWSLVVSQWQQAISLLQAVPLSSPSRGAAQARLSQYQSSLAAAQQRAATLPGTISALPPGATLTVSNDISCPAIASTPESQAVELSNVQFKRNATDPTHDSIIGCITNNTNQAIVHVSVSYQGSSTHNPNLMQSGYSALGFSNLASRQTVPFRSRFEISPDVTNLNIKSIYWTPPGTSVQQQVNTSIALAR